MKTIGIDRRKLVIVGATVLLAGCQIIPRGGEPPVSRPEPTPTPQPTESGLPQDETRHRVALLVPLSGSNGAVGKSIANATTMALLDTNADNLRITTYDTASGAQSAAARAIADGNRLILGPLMGDNVGAVLSQARPADVPLISFSNDTAVAGPDVFVMGHIPEQSVARTVRFARSRGAQNFAALIPEGEYGRRAEAALGEITQETSGRLVAVERYSRGNTSIVSAAERLKAKGGFDTVLIADGARLSIQAAGVFRPSGAGATQLIGTELWSGESAVTRASAMRGAWFSAVSDARFRRFSESYQGRFGSQPYRISTLGYDAVLLTLNVASDWGVGSPFPATQLRDEDGFLGLDGPFRFMRSGIVDRAMEVREIREDGVVVVDPAPSRF